MDAILIWWMSRRRKQLRNENVPLSMSDNTKNSSDNNLFRRKINTVNDLFSWVVKTSLRKLNYSRRETIKQKYSITKKHKKI